MAEPNAIPQPSTEAPAGDPQTQETPPDASTPSTLAPEPETPRGLETSGLRYSEEYEVPWLRGKTPAEAARIAADLYDALQRGEAPSASPTQPTAPSPQMTTSDDLPRVDSSLIYSNPDEYHRQMEARMDAKVARTLQAAEAGVYTPLESMAKSSVMKDPEYEDVFERYGPEVATMMQRLPASARGRPDVWKEAADMVAGRHRKELARVEAERIIAAGRDSGSLPSQGAPPSGVPSKASPLKKLFDERDPSVRGFISDDIGLETVRAHYHKMGYATDEDIAALLQRKPARAAT